MAKKQTPTTPTGEAEVVETEKGPLVVTPEAVETTEEGTDAFIEMSNEEAARLSRHSELRGIAQDLLHAYLNRVNSWPEPQAAAKTAIRYAQALQDELDTLAPEGW